MTDRRVLLRAMFDVAVAAADPRVVLAPHLPKEPKGRVICLSAGKAAAAMAATAERYYLDELRLDPHRLTGIATTRHGHAVSTRRIRVVEVGHPIPDEAGLASADKALQLASSARPEDLLLVLLSGGGSANWVAPADGITFAEKQQLTRALLRSGAPIDEINIVRRHLSRIKGGHLARAGKLAEIITLAISDVPHDDPSAIASGPTVPDSTSLADASAIVNKYELQVADGIRRALQNPKNESCKPNDPCFDRARFALIARPRASLDAAIVQAKGAGYEIMDLGADVEGEACAVAAAQANLALEARRSGRRVAILSGGELTVKVRGNGRGGPNQEYALSLTNSLKNITGIAAIAADTDGADGGGGAASDPAGAIVDERTFSRMNSLGLEAQHFLAANNASAFFAATGDLLETGPTLTNVNDIRVILVD